MNQSLPDNKPEAAMIFPPSKLHCRRWHTAANDVLTLPLLMSRVGRADHVDPALAANQLAAFTNPLDACANFH
jgi:hypothetical protein